MISVFHTRSMKSLLSIRVISTLALSLLAQENHSFNKHHTRPNVPSRKLFATGTMNSETSEPNGNEWKELLPMEDASHRSSKIVIPDRALTDKSDQDGVFDSSTFRQKLDASIACCRNMKKSSLWIEVPMSRASLMEQMAEAGLRLHHTTADHVVLNLWLKEAESKIPDFATHNIGVGGVVINSRNEILCVRELRKNYMKWKTPTGLAELGEDLHEAVCREVLEETGIETTFESVLGFRQTHGLAHGRSDLYLVCRCAPIETLGEHGTPIIPQPTAQIDEIEAAEWVPFSEYRDMVNGMDGSMGHPMMQHIVKVLERDQGLEKTVVKSVVPGRKPNSLYCPTQPGSVN